MNGSQPNAEKVIDAGLQVLLTDGYSVSHEVSEVRVTVDDQFLSTIICGIEAGESHGPLRVDLTLITDGEAWVSAPAEMPVIQVLKEVRKHEEQIWRAR